MRAGVAVTREERRSPPPSFLSGSAQSKSVVQVGVEWGGKTGKMPYRSVAIGLLDDLDSTASIEYVTSLQEYYRLKFGY